MKSLFAFTTKRGVHLSVYDDNGELVVERRKSVSCPGGNKIAYTAYPVTEEVKAHYQNWLYMKEVLK